MIVDKVSESDQKSHSTYWVLFPYKRLKCPLQVAMYMLSKAQDWAKTAERIVVELKDKVLPKELSQDTNVGASSLDKGQQADISQNLTNFQDAVSALLTLGYKATDADLAIRRASESMDKREH